jgi:hypothetical protein
MKLGLNPNSSSLGGDVTFLLLGATALSFFTPFIATLLRARRPAIVGEAGAAAAAAAAAVAPDGRADG